jgi:hypothetical protein
MSSLRTNKKSFSKSPIKSTRSNPKPTGVSNSTEGSSNKTDLNFSKRIPKKKKIEILDNNDNEENIIEEVDTSLIKKHKKQKT